MMIKKLFVRGDAGVPINDKDQIMASANAVNIRVAFFVNKGNATCQIPITFDHAKDDRLWSSYKLEQYFGDGQCGVGARRAD